VDRLVDRDLAEAFPLEVFADAVGLFAEASDVARAVLFVASDDASFVTGSEIVINGRIDTTLTSQVWRQAEPRGSACHPPSSLIM
jgi:NAD(P)-dependent dehydrogenase (short-subunit alcohol dehydrogenase family)